MESIPAEILFDIYLMLDYDNIINLSLVSKYVRDCKPNFQYLHKLKFNDCLREILSMEYKINSAKFTCYDVAIGYCIIYDYNKKLYYGGSIKQEFPYSFKRLNNKATFYIYYSEMCINSTSGYSSHIIAKDCLVTVVSKLARGYFIRNVTSKCDNYGEMLTAENCMESMHLREFHYNIRNVGDVKIQSDDEILPDEKSY